MDRNGLKDVRHRRNDALSRVSWQHFEVLLADYYRGQGFRVEHVGTGITGACSDGGIDLKLRRDDAYILVQCKHWNAKQVPHNDVHQLLGVMVNEGATGAILITSGEFTAAAVQAANRLGHVTLIDGAALRTLLGPLVAPIVPEPDLGWIKGHGGSPLSPRGPRIANAAAGAGTPSPVACDLVSRLLRVRRHAVPGWRGVAWGRLLGAMAVGVALWWGGTHSLAVFRSFAPSGRPAAPVASASPSPAARRVVRPMPERAASTTLSDDPAPRHPRQQHASIGSTMSDAELREWQRRNAESMKILEATTPEL